MPQIHSSIDQAEVDWLEDEAKSRDKSVSWLVKRLIIQARYRQQFTDEDPFDMY